MSPLQRQFFPQRHHLRPDESGAGPSVCDDRFEAQASRFLRVCAECSEAHGCRFVEKLEEHQPLVADWQDFAVGARELKDFGGHGGYPSVVTVPA